jgi:putative Mn2+ efflux pump MntP
MDNSKAAEPTAEQRGQLRIIFQVLGVTHMVMGVAIAVYGPGFVGGDPQLMWICGGLLASLGVPMIWFGRQYARARQGDESPGSVFKVHG